MEKSRFPIFENYEKLDNPTDPIFARMILEWLPKQILLTGLNSEMINALNSDNHKVSRYIAENYASYFLVNLNKPLPKQRRKGLQLSRKWNKGRRFLYIFLDIIGPYRWVLGKATYIDKEVLKRAPEEKWNLSVGIQSWTKRQKEEFYSKQNKSKLYLNLKSIVKLTTHKEALVNWWVNGDIDNKGTPLHIVTSKYEKLKSQNSDDKDWKPSKEEMYKWRRHFTSKFNKYIVECANAYWFRVMSLEKSRHNKKRSRKKPETPVSCYRTYTYSLVLMELFEYNRTKWNREISKNRKLQDIISLCRYPKKQSSFVAAREYIRRCDRNLAFKESKFVPIEQDNKTRCPECDGELLFDVDKGERYCKECGLVPEVKPLPSGSQKREENKAPFKHKYEKSEKVSKFDKKEMKAHDKTKRWSRIPSWQKKINVCRDEILNSRDLIIPRSTRETIEEKIEGRIKAINRYKSLN